MSGETKRRISWLAFLPPVLFLAFSVRFFWGLLYSSDELPSALAGARAPDFDLQPLGYKSMPGDMEGEVLRGNVWASWCAPCRAEHPHLMDLAEEGLHIVGVNYKDQPGQALGFLEELGDPYRSVGADPTGRNGIEWGLYGVPETFVINRAGEIVLRFPGPVTGEVMRTRIRPAVEAAQAE